MAKTVHETFKTFSRIAEKTGTQVDHRPQINVDGNLSSVVSPLSYYRDLRYYRSKLFSFRGESESTALNFTNYAALIAATQIHVGGTKWWLQNNLVGTLHCLEPYISRYASDGFQNQNKKQVLKARWTGYGRVFAGYPLIGFPELEKWNTEVWIGALLRSPLAGGPEDEWAGLSLEKYGKIPFGSWSKAFPLIRDLQIIRPRLFGTLEFRADPAQPSIERVLGLTALRLGLVASLLGGKTPTPVTFGIAKTNWWALVRGSELEGQHPPLLDCAREALKERGNGEEVFLNVFDKIS